MAETVSRTWLTERAGITWRAWPAEASQMGAIRSQVRRWLAPLAVSEDVADDIVLAVSEAASNCVEHAYVGGIRVDAGVELMLWTEPHRVCIVVVDHGAWRVPAGKPSLRGRGIEMMQRLMTEVVIHHDSDGTHVFLSHSLLDAVAATSRR
jgi:anti-sigma regulatory factor (Ser/Thr protein kinase)